MEKKEVEKIYGHYTQEDDVCEVTLWLPTKWAASHELEEKWELEVEMEDETDLKGAVIEELEEEFSQQVEDAGLYDEICSFLNDDRNWTGEIEKAYALYGYEAVEKYLQGR